MVGSGPHQAESMGSLREGHFVNLSKERIGRLVCIPPILAGASPEIGETFLIKRIPKLYN